jgi:hypothetical protein
VALHVVRIALLILLLGTGGCAAIRELFRNPNAAVAPFTAPDMLYEDLAAHYVELCAVSQYRPLEGELGGSPGHAVMYLKGACVDEAAAYPRLRPCRRSTMDIADTEHGAGVSVNRWFRNVNWVATPGKHLFYDGEVNDYELLDQARFDATVDRAIELGMFKGVRFHPKPGAESEPDLRELVAGESIGTDFALRFGRTVFCTRLPMRREMLQRVMDYLNGLNEEYFSGEADYQWSGYSDNCVHTLHNALAAAGVWKPKSIQGTKIRQFFHIAVPANTVVELAFLSNKYPIENYAKIRRDPLRWQGLVEHAWLPAVPGALMKTLPILQVNELYDTRYRMFSLGGWFGNETLKRAQQLMRDGRSLQLDANLRFFHQRYTQILAERDADPKRTDPDRAVYYDYIENLRDRVVIAVRRLAELARVREELRREAYEKWKASQPE